MFTSSSLIKPGRLEILLRIDIGMVVALVASNTGPFAGLVSEIRIEPSALIPPYIGFFISANASFTSSSSDQSVSTAGVIANAICGKFISNV